MRHSCGLIRLARAADGGGVAAIYAPIVRDTFISFEAEAPTAAEMARRIAATLQSLPWLVCEGPDGIAGYAYASRHRDRPGYQWSVDVSCYVHEAARGRGLGKALYAQLLRVLRHQGFHAAFAGIALPNAASVALHESLGFRRIAHYPEVGYKLGAWRDTGWWQLLLGEAGREPPAPLPLRELGPGVLDDL